MTALHVPPEQIRAAAAGLREAASGLEGCRAGAGRLAELPPGLPPLSLAAPFCLRAAGQGASIRWLLRPLVEHAGSLADRLPRASGVYEAVERAVHAVLERHGSEAARMVGRTLPLLAVAFPAAVPASVLAAGAGAAVWLGSGGTPFTPECATLLRLSVEYADDFLAGTAWLPVPGPVREQDAVLAVYRAAVLSGAVATGGWTVSACTPLPVSSGEPARVSDLVGRIPPAEPGGPVVRVTTRRAPDGGLIHEVAITGTQEWAPHSDEALTLAGNAAGYAGVSEQSVAAVLTAMRAAGVRPGDRLVLSAFSQGSLVAQGIAASGDYRVEAIVTVGGLIDPGAVPAEVPILEIAHDNDIVPALRGLRDPGHPQAAFVEVPPPEDRMPHDLELYGRTAAELQRAGHPAVARMQERLDGLLSGAAVVEAAEVSVRLDPETASGGAHGPGPIVQRVEDVSEEYERILRGLQERLRAAAQADGRREGESS
ncbi:MAG: hypothetical protein Q4E05_09715 [Pseudoclavibacter sp.]|nr:hypothetical protein [Pseudoclavibacter sp.]